MNNEYSLVHKNLAKRSSAFVQNLKYFEGLRKLRTAVGWTDIMD